MDIEKLSRQGRLTRTEIRALSAELLSTLSSYIGIELLCFRRHSVDGESFSAHFRGAIQKSGPFDLSFEGRLYFHTRVEPPPSIDAELLLFSRGERIGLRSQRGGSYMSILYRFDKGWVNQGWLGDGPDDWERLGEPRTGEYGTFVETWEPND